MNALILPHNSSLRPQEHIYNNALCRPLAIDHDSGFAASSEMFCDCGRPYPAYSHLPERPYPACRLSLDRLSLAQAHSYPRGRPRPAYSAPPGKATSGHNLSGLNLLFGFLHNLSDGFVTHFYVLLANRWTARSFRKYPMGNCPNFGVAFTICGAPHARASHPTACP